MRMRVPIRAPRAWEYQSAARAASRTMMWGVIVGTLCLLSGDRLLRSRVAIASSSVVEDRQVEESETLRVVEEVELHDLAVPDRDGADRDRLPVAEGHPSRDAVDECRPEVPSELSISEGLSGDRSRAAHLLPPTGPEVGTYNDIRVEHCHEPIEVAVARRTEKRVDDLTLRLEIHVGNRPLRTHAPARPAGELACRLGGAIHDGCDLVERDGEDVMEHECEALGRRKRLEYDKQRQTDGIRQ